MRARILRGAHEIGGSCVEVEHGGARLVLDIGLPLDAGRGEDIPLPPISGLNGDDRSLLGVIVTHGHPDHYGLAPEIHASVPLYVGAATERMLREASFFGPIGTDLSVDGHLADRVPLHLGPFSITPYLVDHSAFDAYALLVEAGGRRLFYTGDLRGHGRKASVFERLLADPPAAVDVLLMEGTHVRLQNESSSPVVSEGELELNCAEAFRATSGMVLACYSAQHIDRLVTLYRAAKRSGRQFVMDLYTATIARATGRDTIPQQGWADVRVFLPSGQRRRVIREQAFERTEWVHPSRIYPEELSSRRSELVMTFRESMIGDLERAGCLGGGALAWSLWPGYLDAPDSQIRSFCERHSIPLRLLHTSGHASLEDLRRLATAIDANRVVPIHTSAPELFPDHFPNVESHEDEEWWEA